MTKLHQLVYATTKCCEELHGIYQFTKCNLVLDLNFSNSRISPAITVKLQFREHTFCKTTVFQCLQQC